MCYITGGSPDGAATRNPGARDKTGPKDSRAIALQYALYFAGYSRSWKGAPAFIRKTGENSVTCGRMYLVTYDQFNDVVLQENGRPVDGTRIIPSYEELAAGNEFELPGHLLYGRLIHTGDESGHPILTFSTSRKLDIGAPSEAYVKVIAAGLKETYPGMAESGICAYLRDAEGIAGSGVAAEKLASWVSQAGRPASFDSSRLY